MEKAMPKSIDVPDWLFDEFVERERLHDALPFARAWLDQLVPERRWHVEFLDKPAALGGIASERTVVGMTKNEALAHAARRGWIVTRIEELP